MTDAEHSYRLQTARNSICRALHLFENEIYDSVLRVVRNQSISMKKIVSGTAKAEHLLWKHMAAFEMDTFISDDIVNFFVHHLQTRAKEAGSGIGLLSSFFYTKLSQLANGTIGISCHKVDRWFKPNRLRRRMGLSPGRSIFEAMHVIIPLHLYYGPRPVLEGKRPPKGNHWCIGLWRIQKRQMAWFNSLSQPAERDRFFENSRALLQHQYDKRQTELDFELDFDDWEFIDYAQTWSLQRDDRSYVHCTTADSASLSELEVDAGGALVFLNGEEYIVTRTSASKATGLCARNETEYNLTLYPPQTHCDCGVFTLKCAEFIAHGLHPDFEEKDVAEFRKRLCVQCVGERLD